MITLLIWIAVLALTCQAVIGFAFFFYSILEREKRATIVGGVQFVFMAFLLFIFVYAAVKGYFYTDGGKVILTLGLLITFLSLFFLGRKTGPNEKALDGAQGYVVGEAKRFDERDIVFARNRLKSGTKEYESFYQKHPELKEIDDKKREKGGSLGKLGSIDSPFEKPNVAAMASLQAFGFQMADKEIITPGQSHMLKGVQEVMDPAIGSEKVKGFSKHLGGSLVGITKVDPRWVYSHRGMVDRLQDGRVSPDWAEWGKEIDFDHQYAIVIAEEMDREMVDSGPHSPCCVESMHNYAKGAYITTRLAAYIANLGYNASANHIRSYDVILPPLAADAGLGEVGRMGYLLTKEFGPRVRLSAVITDMPLLPDEPKDIGVEDFCRICKKCARTCPSRSIPVEDEMTEVNGSRRWVMDAESCYAYWSKVGTDCSICMKVCPWSHARTWPHKLIVWWISRNKWARRIFNHMDDIFYGEKPVKPKQPPAWVNYK